MKSTGEVMGKDRRWKKPYIKDLLLRNEHSKIWTVLFTVADKDKQEALKLAKRFSAIGYRLNGNKRYSSST